MSYKIFSIPPFDKQLKRLSKKYPSVFLLSIFDKSEDENIPDSELKFLLKLIK